MRLDKEMKKKEKFMSKSILISESRLQKKVVEKVAKKSDIK